MVQLSGQSDCTGWSRAKQTKIPADLCFSIGEIKKESHTNNIWRPAACGAFLLLCGNYGNCWCLYPLNCSSFFLNHLGSQFQHGARSQSTWRIFNDDNNNLLWRKQRKQQLSSEQFTKIWQNQKTFSILMCLDSGSPGLTQLLRSHVQKFATNPKTFRTGKINFLIKQWPEDGQIVWAADWALWGDINYLLTLIHHADMHEVVSLMSGKS